MLVIRRACAVLSAVVAMIATLFGGATAVSALAAPGDGTSPVAPGAYWLLASDGGIFSFGGVPFVGSAGGTRLSAPIVSMSATPSGKGYWLAGSGGDVYAYGDAAYAGSPSTVPVAARPSSPSVAIVATPDGGGYWVTTANGSVYAFGNAPFLGSLGGVRLVSPIVGMAATPSGLGYWLVASDGGVFTFGDALFAGSAGAIHLTRPIVGMSATMDGAGSWLVASDGGIVSFGSARFFGSTGAIKLNQPIVGMAASPSGAGYWMVASDGGIFSFGDAPFRGSTGNRRLNRPIVAMAVGRTLDPYRPNGKGFDISFPNCGSPYPTGPFDYGIVGVNHGIAFTRNQCLASQWQWALQAPAASAYMNINAPQPGKSEGATGPAGQCVGNDTGCFAYNYGYNAAVDAFTSAAYQGVNASVWWLDVELVPASENPFYWDSNTTNNARTIQGALDALCIEGVVAGIYSTYYQFTKIAGNYAPGVPIWKATAADLITAETACSDYGPYYRNFGAGPAWLTQYGSSSSPFDLDYACPTPT
ncbi:MAG: hypothetical protein NVS3B12_21610 [Acidimicrobiales bacterium]